MRQQRNWMWLVLVSGVLWLAACGGGGDGSNVLYRDDGVLVVDGREYPRRTPQEIDADTEKYGSPVFGLLNVLGKPGVQSEEINMYLHSYELSSNLPDCQLFLDEYRCWIAHIAVPPDWADQWRRAMANWHWVESVEYSRIAVPADPMRAARATSRHGVWVFRQR